MNRNTHEMLSRLEALGITRDDAFAIRRIAMTLHHWFELECGVEGAIPQSVVSVEREGDEDNSPPFMRVQYPTRQGYVDNRWRVPDRETGARKRLVKLMARYPELHAYVQGDPRGAPLYIMTKHYWETSNGNYSRGIAVYK